MICKNCGAILSDDATVCTTCGESMVDGGALTGMDPLSSSTVSSTPQSAWMPYGDTTFEYDVFIDDSHSTPETVFPEGYDARAAAEDDYKKAKAAYKVARKRAGKTGVPKVLAIILAILIAAGGAGFGVWYYMRGQAVHAEQTQQVEDPASDEGKDAQAQAAAQKEAEEAAKKEAEAEAAHKQTEEEAAQKEEVQKRAGAESAANVNQDPLIGVWTGTLQKPSNGRYFCFGGQVLPPTLTITELDETGRMKANLSMCFHNHENMANPADSNPDDVLLEFSDLTFFLDNGSFSYKLVLEGDYEGDEITIDGTVIEEDGLTKIKLSLESYYEPNWDRQTDVYVLTKEQ